MEGNTVDYLGFPASKLINGLSQNYRGIFYPKERKNL